jgi:lipoprotein-anchoring transpeptidase ErfK/SrfK
MNRVRMRASRALVALLIITIGVVLFATRKRAPEPNQSNSSQVTQPNPNVIIASNPAPLLILASNTPLPPIAAPTTQPIAAPATQPLIAIAPTTRPTTQPAGELVAAPALSPLALARQKIEREPAVARRILSEQLLAGTLSSSEQEEAREMLGRCSEQMIFSKRLYKDDPTLGTYIVKPNDRLINIASAYGVTPELLARVNGIGDINRIQAGQTLKVIKGPFYAVVSKSRFTMDIYLGQPHSAGSTFITSYRVGLGKDDSTPLGTWRAERKLKNPVYYSPRGEGIIAADDPKNPLGEYWIGLSGIDGEAVGKSSYGIHGTIDPASIGREESMGCIRMKNEDVERVYELLVDGKSVVVVTE